MAERAHGTQAQGRRVCTKPWWSQGILGCGSQHQPISASAPAARADTTASEKGMRDVLVVLGIIDRISQYCPKSQAHRYRGPLLFVAGTVIITIIAIVFLSCVLLILTIRRRITRALPRTCSIGAIERLIVEHV